MTQPAPSLVRTVLDGKFQIERALASGAAGDVYEATHLTLGSRVAVKVLRDGSKESADVRRKRFLREARLAAGIQSEHVVRVFDFGAHESGPTYIVMELLQGETLAERLRRSGPLAMSAAVDYVIQAATPLTLLHDTGVVHRDVKPSNLFLARDSEGKERVKLLDFGVAAFRRPVGPAESSLTFSRAIIGTPRYMAPEQVRASGLVDARADVWALGVTLYELLAGRPPFAAESVLAVLKQIERASPVPLHQRRPQVPPELAAVVHSCLQKDPDKRPANARALLEALTPMRTLLESLATAATAGDPLELSLHDPDVEVMPGARAAARVRLAVGAVAVLLLGSIAAAAVAGRHPASGRQDPPPPIVLTGGVPAPPVTLAGGAPVPVPTGVPTAAPSATFAAAISAPAAEPRPAPATPAAPKRPAAKAVVPRSAVTRPAATARPSVTANEPLE
jgi:serine/threonine-protein kinase